MQKMSVSRKLNNNLIWNVYKFNYVLDLIFAYKVFTFMKKSKSGHSSDRSHANVYLCNFNFSSILHNNFF